MNIQNYRKLKISEKILVIFFLVSFIPICLFIYFSKSYITNLIQHDTQINLLKDAKSYGLFTFDKLDELHNQLKQISATTDSVINNNTFSGFESLELIKLSNHADADLDNSKRSKFYFASNKNLQSKFAFERLHTDTANNHYILRATFLITDLFPSKSENPFSQPICIFTELGATLFCNEDVLLQDENIQIISELIGNKERLIQHEFDGNTYELAFWELFLSSHFQSESWYFVIIKQQSLILETIKKFERLVILLGLVILLSIAYGIYSFVNRLMSPLNSLTDATRMISHGNFAIKLDINSEDEFKELSDSFSTMSNSLVHQNKKDEILSSLEHSVLINSDIHIALKDNIENLAELFQAKWLIVSFLSPLNKDKMDSHCVFVKKHHSGKNYAYATHKIFDLHRRAEDFFSIDQEEFRQHYNEISAAFSSNSIWVKKLSLNNDIIGALFIGTKDDSQLSSLTTSDVIEFSERFSTIYTTHQQRSELYFKAHYDSLTKLSNRSHLLEALKIKWPQAIEYNNQLTIFYIDLDNFKNVNDLSGHKAGNEVLIEASKRLANCINDNSLLARLSGDEFCILSNENYNIKDIINQASRIINDIKKPITINDMSFFLGASIGVAQGPQNCKSPEALIEHADLAMYKAKQDGKNRFVIYDDEIEKQRNYRLSLEHHLHYALENNEISINFQPKIDLNTGKMTSVECLARWNQRELGFVPTDKFISLAEESGMIIEIGAWILKKSCYQFVDWLQKDIQLDSIAVNVSARQLASRNFSELVESVISETKIPPHCLELEVTESAFINDEALLNCELEKLHALGTKISIDDFGKEYSSLSYLKKIPFDTLKIDREFIIDLETDYRDQHIIDVIINIGHTLNKKIVAEGIETINQRDILKKCGCDIGQGYLFSRPLSDIEFLEFAAKFKQQGLITETLYALNA